MGTFIVCLIFMREIISAMNSLFGDEGFSVIALLLTVILLVLFFMLICESSIAYLKYKRTGVVEEKRSMMFGLRKKYNVPHKGGIWRKRRIWPFRK